MLRLTKRQSRFRQILCASVVYFQIMDNVYAQSNPGLSFGQVPTAGQWNSFFANKADWPGVFGQTNTWTGQNTFTSAANFGQTGSFTGLINFFGITSGQVSVTSQLASGTWTWTFPNSIGTQGAALQTGGTQSGSVLSWTAGPPWNQFGGSAKGVSFATIADTQINLTIPTAAYVFEGVWILNTGTVSSLAGGSFSICSLAGATGTCIVSGGVGTLSAIVGSGINVPGNATVIVLNNHYSNNTTWFFRITTPVANASGDVVITVHPLPVNLP